MFIFINVLLVSYRLIQEEGLSAIAAIANVVLLASKTDTSAVEACVIIR